MNDFVVTPRFLTIALWVAMETMHLHIAGISFFLRFNLFCIQRVPKINWHQWKIVLGCKVGQIRCWGIMYSIWGFTSLRAILHIINYARILWWWQETLKGHNSLTKKWYTKIVYTPKKLMNSCFIILKPLSKSVCVKSSKLTAKMHFKLLYGYIT